MKNIISILCFMVFLCSYILNAQQFKSQVDKNVHNLNNPNTIVEIHYDSTHNNGVGAANADFIVAARLTHDKLKPYVDESIKSINIYIQDAPVGSVGKVKIYGEGTSIIPGTLLYSSDTTHVVPNSWNLIPLSKPITISGADLWIGFEATATASTQYWGGCDAGPNDPDGQWIYFNNAWAPLTSLNAGLTYNWNIRAEVNDAPTILNKFNLNLPTAGASITSYPKVTRIVNFTWDTSSSTAVYKWTFGSPTLSSPKLSFNINTNLISFNINQLDTLLAYLGMIPGDSLVGEWGVIAYRNNPPINDSLAAANNPRSITLKRGIPELIAFDLKNPGDNTRIVTSFLNNSNLIFNWRKSGDGVNYKFKFGQTLTSPILDFPSNNGGYDTTWSLNNNILDKILQNVGLAPGDSTIGVWAIYGHSGSDSLKSVQSFNLILKRQVKGEVLVAYDASQTNGIISRDSIVNNLTLKNKTFDLFDKGGNTSTNSLPLREYKYVIWLGESSSVMSKIQKDSIRAYLNSGTINGAPKSKLIIFSEDVGFQLDRSLSTYKDTAFSRGMLGIEFILDRPLSGGNQVLLGDALNSGISDSTVGSWPDLLKTSWLHSKRLYAYSNKYLSDTGCGIGYIGPKWNTAIIATDVRALRSSYKSPAGSPVARILNGILDWIDEKSTPVELTSFTASSSGNSVNLYWMTATETNNSGYSVERKNSNENFTSIGFIKGKGTTSEVSSYSFKDNNLTPGSYIYRLKQVDFDGKVSFSNEVNVDVTAPAVFALEQNYPNPFNPGTSIKYSILQDGMVSLAIYNVLGAKVTTLINQNMAAGKYEVKFDASHYASGIYFYRLDAGQYSSVKKMILLK